MAALPIWAATYFSFGFLEIISKTVWATGTISSFTFFVAYWQDWPMCLLPLFLDKVFIFLRLALPALSPAYWAAIFCYIPGVQFMSGSSFSLLQFLHLLP